MTYFSPRVIAYNPVDPNNYVCPAASKGEFRAPRFSLLPTVVRDDKTVLTDAVSGTAAVVTLDKVRTATAHSVARIMAVIFATLATLALGALPVVTIWFPAVVILPSTLMMIGIAIGSYYLIALAIAVVSKRYLKNELILKPKQLKDATTDLDPIKKECKIALKPIGSKRPGPGIAYQPVPDAKDADPITNRKVKLYDMSAVETAKGHRVARITAFVLGVLGTLALVVFGALTIFNPAAIVFVPLPILAGVIGGVLATAFLIHAISKRTIKNEVVQIMKPQLLVKNMAAGELTVKSINLYKDTTNWGHNKLQFISKRDLKEVEKYQDNYQLTQEFDTNNNNQNKALNQGKHEIYRSDSWSYKIGYFFFKWFA